MASRFGWVDFAEEDRQKMLDVVQLFREQETRDELGIGSIRDAFADHFFPGTSTIQTRARYMLFVPWIYLILESKGISSAQAAGKARQYEINLIYALLRSQDTSGVIGKEAKDDLQRLPSSVYWSGLGSWGIRLFPGSQEQYHRYLDIYYRRRDQASHEDGEDPVGEVRRPNWDPGLPKPPKGFLEEAGLSLARGEAQYLQERILEHHRGGLLARLVSEELHCDADFIWNHPIVSSLPLVLRTDLDHARSFSESIYGAALLYNLMLAQACRNKDLTDQYSQRMEEWAASLTSKWSDLAPWHERLGDFWASEALKTARVPRPTRDFVESWLDLLFKVSKPALLSEDKAARALIEDREIKLKRSRARLANERARELWKGAAGDVQLNYRWNTAKSIVADILAGLGDGGTTHA